MKNREITLNFGGRKRCRVELTNLRYDTEAEGLCAAPQLALTGVCPGRLLLDLDGTMFVANGAALYVMKDGRVQHLATLDAAPLCVAPVPRGCVTVMARGMRPCRARLDSDGWVWLGPMPQFVMPALSVATKSALGVETAPVEGSFRRDDSLRLTTDTLRKLNAAITEAYLRLSEAAETDGAFMQPVLARVRLVGHDGDTLAATAPVLLTPGQTPFNAVTATATADITTTNSCTVRAMHLSANTFRLRLTWPTQPDAEMRRWVSAVAVDVSSQCHPLRPGAWAMHAMTLQNASAMQLRVSIPGVALDGVPGAHHRAMIEHALMHFDSEARTIATFPLEGVPSQPFYASSGITAEREVALAAARSTSGRGSVNPVGALLRRCNAAAWSAATCAVAADAVVWGNIQVANSAPLPGEFGVTHNNEAWTNGWCEVTLHNADGTDSRVVTRAAGSSACPVALSPLVVVNDARATQLRVSNGSKMATVSLTPTPDGTAAYALNPTLEPFSLAASVSGLPANVTTYESYDGALLCAAATAPLHATALHHLGGGEVVTLAPAVRRHTAWESRRTAFLIFATDGVYSLSGLADAPVRIAPPLGCTPATVVAGASTLYAGVGLRVLAVTPSGVSECLRLPRAAVALGYNNSANELWALLADDTLYVYPLDTSLPPYSLSVSPTQLLTGTSGLWLSDGTNISMASDAVASTTAFEMMARITVPHGWWELTGVSADMVATALHATLTVLTDGGCGPGDADMHTRQRLDGTCRGSVELRCRGAVDRWLYLHIKGSASADLRIGTIHLTLTPLNYANR